MIRPLRLYPETTVDDLLGILKYKGPPKSLDEMDAAIARGARAAKASGT